MGIGQRKITERIFHEPRIYFMHLFWHKKSDVVRRWSGVINLKTFWYSSSYSLPTMKVEQRTLDSSYHLITGNEVGWLIELMAVKRTKHKMPWNIWKMSKNFINIYKKFFFSSINNKKYLCNFIRTLFTKNDIYLDFKR